MIRRLLCVEKNRLFLPFRTVFYILNSIKCFAHKERLSTDTL